MKTTLEVSEILNPFALSGSSPPKGVYPEWLTASEAADYIRASIKTLYNLKCKGKLKGYNTGGGAKGRLLFKKSDLDNFITGKSGV